jgi:hypothetical protein
MVRKWGTDSTQVGKIYGTVSPAGTVTAPVTFDYTAPAKGTPEAKLWTTSYPPVDGGFPMSVSRRGIGGSTFSVPFDSGATGWRIERHNRIEIAGKTIFVGRHDAVLRQLEEPLSDGSTHEGAGKFVGNAVAGVRHCLKHKSIPAQSLTKEMRATATATPIGDDSVDFAFSIVPAKEAKTMDDAMFLMDQMVLATYPLGSSRGVKTFVDTMVPPSPCGEEVRQIVTHKFRPLR